MAQTPRFRVTHPAASHLIETDDDVLGWVKDLDQMFNLLPSTLNWRYDDNDSIVGVNSEDSLQQGTQEILDAFLADYTAQALASAWRAQEACESAIYALNHGWLVAFDGLARLALESSFLSMARFQDFLVRVKGLNHATTNEKWAKEWELFDKSNNSANFGRHQRNPGDYPFTASSIYSHFDRAKEYLKAKDTSEVAIKHVERVYGTLCEITHPNAEGLQVYWNLEGAERIVPGSPSYRKLEANRGMSVTPENLPLRSGLWAVGFAGHFTTEVFHRFKLLQVTVTNRQSGFGKQTVVFDPTRENPILLS